MRQKAKQYQPSVRTSWAIGILSAASDKHGALMQRLAMRALHRRDPGHRLHDSAQCDLCLPATKYFTPGQVAPAQKSQPPSAIKPAPVPEPEAKPIPPIPAAKPIAPPPAPPRTSTAATYKGLAGLASILRSPSSGERQPQLSNTKGEE